MNIDDLVTYRERQWIVRGFSRMGTSETYVHLEHEGTGDRVLAPLDEVAPEPAGSDGAS